MPDTKTAVIRSDGGICSQISFAALGRELELLGYTVKYDLSWFEEFGADLNKKQARNYDMLKAFPDLKLLEADKDEIFYFKTHYKTFKGLDRKLDDNLYIDGYPEERPYLSVKHREYFIQHFKPADLDKINDVLEKMRNTSSCAVHVRRGDLSAYNPAYGEPVSAQYFLDAMELLCLKDKNIVFYFFSDEIEWVKENILPKIEGKYKYELVNKNGADKGYLDLYAVSSAEYIIASNGSFGSAGKILSKKNALIILPKYLNHLCRNMDNIIVLNQKETYPEELKKEEPKDYYPKYKKYKRLYNIFLSVSLILSAVLFCIIIKAFII